MSEERIFSWAEDANGRMVHVDSVPRGLKCNCFCPYCHEPLVARHGEVKEHGFAHHSEDRQSRLEICYQITLYKLAEQIIQSRKSIIAPSYYGIFPAKEISFSDVKVDSSFEREDKQPDVIATTEDGEQYLIEFTFEYKVQHKRPLDYKNLNCIEIDLSNQTLDSLQQHLFSKPTEDWQWINNDLCFNHIEEKYIEAKKKVRVVCEDECEQCKLLNYCCAVRKKDHSILVIHNNGKTYRLCKSELFEKREEEQEKRLRQEKQRLKEQEEHCRLSKEQRQREDEKRQQELENNLQKFQERQEREEAEQKRLMESTDPSTWSCFNCTVNLSWANRDGFAHCGCYQSLGVPKRTPPELARNCKRYRPKLQVKI